MGRESAGVESPAAARRRTAALAFGLAALALLGVGGCAHPVVVGSEPDARPANGRTSVAIITPRCAGVQSCLLGHVTAAESARPLARAAVFLQRTETGEAGERILTLTDDEGVFAIRDPPPGHYRLAIYQGARRVELAGMELGAAGTTVVPVRLALQ